MAVALFRALSRALRSKCVVPHTLAGRRVCVPFPPLCSVARTHAAFALERGLTREEELEGWQAYCGLPIGRDRGIPRVYFYIFAVLSAARGYFFFSCLFF